MPIAAARTTGHHARRFIVFPRLAGHRHTRTHDEHRRHFPPPGTAAEPRGLGYRWPMPSPLDRWFATEILVHEEALLRYLRRCWPHQADVHDLRQEVYVRVYEAAGRALPTQPRAFLFASARNLLADRARRARVVSIEPMGDFEPSHVLVDERSPDRWCGGRQALKRLAVAFDRLPGRCREVVRSEEH